MRVVFLTHNYPRHPGDLAGAFLHPLAVALRAEGCDVRVVAPSDRGQGGEDELDGVPIERVRYASPTRERYAYSGTMQDLVRSPGGWAALARLFRALRAGARRQGGAGALVHAHWWFPAGVAAPRKLPLVTTLHGTDGVLLTRHAAARLLAGPILRRSAAVTAVSSSLAQATERAVRLPHGAIVVQPMPVPSEHWEWSSGGGGVVVVARLTAQKRVHLALEAVARLAALGRAVPLTVVGDGPERGALEQAAKRLGLRAEFTGTVPPARVREILATADLALQLSHSEGFGLAAAEALMAGVPVVACRDGGGLLDVVPPSGAGRVVEPGAEAIARGMGDLLDDQSARQAARACGETWRGRLAPKAVAQRFLELYARALHA